MSRSLNKMLLLGNVGQDPEVRKTGKGTKVANFSLATERTYGDKKTDWHKITAWGKVAEIIENYVKKGDRLFIEGQVEYQHWTDEDGKSRYSTDIIVKELLMLGGSGGKKEAPKKKPLSDPEPDDDLPF